MDELFPSELDTYDWEQAFEESDHFRREDIDEILMMSEGDSGNDAWLIAVKLKSGKFGFLCADCCYTGWDVSSGGHSRIHDTIFDLMANTNKNDLERLFSEKLKNTEFGLINFQSESPEKLEVICDFLEESGDTTNDTMSRIIRSWVAEKRHDKN